MNFLTVDDVLELHHMQIARYGGRHGLRDRGLLESAVAQAEASFAGKALHPDIPSVAAAYLFHICKNHPFVDGNKRTALAAAAVFLDDNGYEINQDEQVVATLVEDVASGIVDKAQLIALLRSWVEPMPLVPTG